ncbi:phosphoglycerate mutase-like protein [Daedalea quercina L-15889]|uniref:Phosphoglycerate mutase-like protein n=1 Tax=Daedalea quercina L-15889 TaxID=1314783 RepID=A0A165NLF8_9APHY|nr:phosphoglycerate mutase-like protein [Daedalea quercina L-15889]
MVSDSAGDVIGVVIIARHGDRRGYYQSPDTYTASDTIITPLGEVKEWQLGALLRSIYLNESSSSYIQGIAPLTSAFNLSQVQVYADNSGEGSVIMDSAAALVQGLWQPTDLQNTTLANGSTIISPLGGYQYVPINSVDPDGDITVDGTTDCTAFNTHTTTVYNSSLFQAKAEAASLFFSALSPYVGDRSLQLSNMVGSRIFDYVNVQSIHNATFASALPDGLLAQARALVNWQQYQVFTDPSFDGIGNVGFRTMLPGILDSFDQFQNASAGLKLSYYAISYKPFLGLFNMTGAVNDGQVPEAIVDYAGSTVFELRQPSNSSEPTVRLMFKNGTSAAEYSPVTMSFAGWDGAGRGTDVPLSTFASAFAPAAVNSTAEWCQICGTTAERGCAEALAAATAAAGSGGHARISRVGAGFLGAGLTAAVFLMALGVLVFLGVLTAGGRRWRKGGVALSEENIRSKGGEGEIHFEVSSELFAACTGLMSIAGELIVQDTCVNSWGREEIAPRPRIRVPGFKF